MRISVIAVGTRMPSWVSEAVAEYCRRMPRELKLLWREIPLARRTQGATAGQLSEREGEQLLKAIPPGDKVIALDVPGKRITTAQLAQQLASWQMSGDNYSLLIGGPDGLSPRCLERADARWSLSDLTLPHPLVRVILAEQLYRAWTITVNHPYHRE
ncbi:MAG: 23S rRNA (pseudouridine(1915)-N(3))-methyltransferase RlmH [Halieaceae bacterium]|nr:23S rRNA (pseudouridine(1915)-N(3))-methyltransferase RlmH [Halieaceae bacterium]